jgi:hypothetical protein
MKVEYFIGIVPPEEYMKRIEHFQRCKDLPLI